jgi:N-acetylglucosamine-6-phosphate deacetylase
MTVLSGARLVTPAGVLPGGWLRLAGERIAEVGVGPLPAAPDAGAPAAGLVELGGGYLVPGFIDLHVHGGGGHDFTGSSEELAAGLAFHRAHGTTRALASLMAAAPGALCEQLGRVAALAATDGRLVGAHVEGPFLADTRCGAQDPARLARPDRGVLDALLAAGQGRLRSMTVAPELPGALEMIAALDEAGVLAAVGHTDAGYDEAAAGFAAGARLVTHLYNGMPPLHHRAPGAALAALQSGAALEIINDGVHVHPAMVRLAAAHGIERLVLVTDAMHAAGMADGEYLLGGLPVTVAGGQARGSSTGTLAGSTLTMDVAFRRAVVEVGLPVEDAVRAASTNPARVLGLAGRCGAIGPGLDADLVHLDDDLRLRRVMIAGAWL